MNLHSQAQSQQLWSPQGLTSVVSAIHSAVSKQWNQVWDAYKSHKKKVHASATSMTPLKHMCGEHTVTPSKHNQNACKPLIKPATPSKNICKHHGPNVWVVQPDVCRNRRYHIITTNNQGGKMMIWQRSVPCLPCPLLCLSVPKTTQHPARFYIPNQQSLAGVELNEF